MLGRPGQTRVKNADIEGVGNRASEAGNQALRRMGPRKADAVNSDWHCAGITIEFDRLGLPAEDLHAVRKSEFARDP